MSKEQFLKDNQRDGEVYAGLILGKAGERDYHLFKLPGEAEGLTWAEAKVWAEKAGGDAPNRRDQSLLFANAKEHFKAAWYWSSELHASDARCAWYQGFSNGFQFYYGVSSRGRAVAVRKLFI